MGKDFPERANEKRIAPDSEPVIEMFVEAVSPCMRAVEAMIRELAHSELPVLLLGEPGSGKRSMAQRIHQMSRHEGEVFRTAHCATLTAELFQTASDGLFNRGTVFLEEISDLTPDCQTRLLEALPKTTKENGHKATLGARLICGSSRDLEAEVKSGRLREDIYYRISGICLRLPPLRQRREDIPSLVSFFLSKYAHDFRRSVPVLSAQTQQLFQDYAWPGNIRELEDAAKAIADANTVEPSSRSAGITNQLQGIALQVETDRVWGIRGFLALRRGNEEEDRNRDGAAGERSLNGCLGAGWRQR